MMQRPVRRLPWLRLALVGAILLVAGLGLSRVRLDANVLDLLPSELRDVQGLRLLLAHFGQPGELVVTVEASDPLLAASSASSLAAALQTDGQGKSTVVDAPPWDARPETLASLAAYALVNQPPEHFRDVLAKLNPAAAGRHARAAMEAIGSSFSPVEATRLGYDPLDLLSGLGEPDAASATGEFSSTDGRCRILYVWPIGGSGRKRPPTAWLDAVLHRITQWEAAAAHGAQVRVGWTGEPAFVKEITAAMSRDMMVSSVTSILFSALLFYFVHRRISLLGRAFFYVGMAFAAAVGLTAMVFPNVTVISVGFGAILAGLTADYVFLITHRWRCHPDNLSSLRAATAPGIVAAALTTAVAFLSLNLSGLPGLFQLGTIIAVGVLAAAFLMVGPFSRDLARRGPIGRPTTFLPQPALRLAIIAGKTATWALCTAGAAILILGHWPRWAVDATPMRPRHSVAYATMDRMVERFGQGKPTRNILVTGNSTAQVAEKLWMTRKRLERAIEEGTLIDFELPDRMWPQEDFQRENLRSVASAQVSGDALAQTLRHAGFTDAAAYLTKHAISQWKTWTSLDPPIWPDDEAFRWIARRTMSHETPPFVACGLAVVPPGKSSAVEDLARDLAQRGIYLTAWSNLGKSVAAHVLPRGIVVTITFLIALTATVAVVFRNVADTFLVILSLGMVLLIVAGITKMAGLSWNFVNLSSLALILGMGIDFSIHIIFALRQCGGNANAVYREVGAPISLCAATTGVGFWSLAGSETQGLSDLGATCAIGITSAYLVAVFLLPTWWRTIHSFRRP